MRPCFFVIVFSLYSVTCLAQKPPIDASALKKWTSVSDPQISNNGAYASYVIENQPVDKRTVVVLSTKNNWKLEIAGYTSNIKFTSDSRYAIFIKGKDSLVIIKTGNDIVHYIPFVQSFILPKSRNASLIYQLSNPQKKLKIYDLKTEKEKNIDFVKQYLVSDDGSTLVYLTEEKKDSIVQALHWFDIASGDMATIWQGANAENFVFANSGKQIAFSVEQPPYNQTEKTFWYYKAGTEKAIELATDKSVIDDSTLKLKNIVGFSNDDSSLFINLEQRNFSKAPPSLIDIWSYTDVKLKPLQLKEVFPKTYKAIINIDNSQLIRLEKENESLILPTAVGGKANHWGLIVNKPGDVSEAYWNTNSILSVFLVSMRDGNRKKIEGLTDYRGNISPYGKYVIYYDPKQNNYFSYETKSGIICNITKGIPVIWQGYSKDRPNASNFARGIAGWLENDEGVLIYDKNDIWLIDMAGRKPPINLTNGYGKKHNTIFFLSNNGLAKKIFSSNERLMVNAFNVENKENGYFSKTLSKAGDPELLSMGPYLYDIPGNPYIPDGSNFAPVKAKNAELYLVRRMTATEAPNIFSTTDFKSFTPLSNVHPEKSYNWLTSELVSWKALNGDSLQGILYKPENFDPRKKYPVIFHYYEQKSDGLHAFLQPEILSNGTINIPWYTSNGYLVFLPDIHYKIGETGESVINSVVSAANHLSKMPWVNTKKMGIQGHSFGGYETNYLVTHTNLFAAACSASGLSNLVSAYGSINGYGASGQAIIEFTQVRMGASLWQRPDLYIKNSPVFSANEVTTPLLIMHTKQDGVCPFTDAIEFFTALRRLGKIAWMLQYNEGNHGVSGKAGEDFSIRMRQFFDHYLKDSAAPRWMMYQIPASDNGYELVREKDPKTGKWVTPKESDLLTDEEKRKVEAIQERKAVTIKLK